MFKLVFEKAEEPEIKLPTSVGSSKKQESSRKTSISVYCHPAYLTYMQSTSWETLGWRKHKLEWRLLEVKWSEVKWSQSCPTLCDPMDCSLPGSSVHGILQARILEWASIPFSRGSSQPRARTQVFCITSRFFTIWVTSEAQERYKGISKPFLSLVLSSWHVRSFVGCVS